MFRFPSFSLFMQQSIEDIDNHYQLGYSWFNHCFEVVGLTNEQFGA